MPFSMHTHTCGELRKSDIGAEVTLTGPADVALCTADRLGEADDAVGIGEIAVLSLDAFGKGVPDLPVGITDYATAVRRQGDQIFPEPDPGPALAGPDRGKPGAHAADGRNPARAWLKGGTGQRRPQGFRPADPRSAAWP